MFWNDVTSRQAAISKMGMYEQIGYGPFQLRMLPHCDFKPTGIAVATKLSECNNNSNYIALSL